MLPGSTELIKHHLIKLLGETSIESEQKLTTHGKYEDYAKFKHENVMVANVKDEIHLQAYTLNKFFHIPTKTLFHVKPGVEYIAFYFGKESKTFPNEHKEYVPGVCFYGKIISSKIYLRDEGKELPKSSKESYIRSELDDIKKVGPISTVEYGVRNMMYTTLYLLENADNVHELKLKSRKEIVLYKRLKEMEGTTGRKLERFREYYMLGDVRVELMENREIRIRGEIYSFRDGLECLKGISTSRA